MPANFKSWFSKDRASAPKGAPLDVRRLLAPVGLGLLFGISGLFLFQTYGCYVAEDVSAGAERITTQARQALGGFVSERQRALGEALVHPEIERYFASGEAGDPVRALAAIRERMREVEDARFVDADVLNAIGNDIASFGYANAEMLLNAARMGAPAPAQVHGRQGTRELVLVNPVTVRGTIVGFVLAKLPYGPLRDSFVALPDGGLRLVLLQGDAGQTTEALEGAGEAGMNTAAIPGSMLRIGYKVPEPLIIAGPSTFWGNLITAIVALLASVLIVLWRQRPDLIERLLHPRSAGGPAALTVAEQALAEAQRPATATKAATPSKPSKPEAEAAAPPPAPSRAPAPAKLVTVDRSIFRAYDIRGVVGTTLNAAVANAIGQSVGSEVRSRGLQTVLVARDGHLSGPELADALIKGLLAAGCDVIDIGPVPTPVLYFATHDLNAGSCVMVTGSHQSADHNGFKIMIAGETLAEQEIQAIYARIAENRLESGRGALTQMDLTESYIERISGDIQLESPLKVVIDCGNGIAGSIAQRLFESIGCEVVPLHCEVDGNFPNHHPDPSDPGTLVDLIASVKQFRADIGLAFDGDGDRLGVVTPQGKIVNPDHVLMLFARDVLVRNPGAAIIYDVKCTGHLSSVILGHGGSPMMWKTGHSLIKKKMKEVQAELAGEMSGHYFFKERWYGFDDGLYAGCRLLEVLAGEGRDADEVFEELPQGVSTPELRIPMAEGEHYRFMDKFRDRAKFDGARVTTIDGVRADWNYGWGLVRCSNTSASLVLRFDADDGDALAKVQGAFRAQLLGLDAKMQLPF